MGKTNKNIKTIRNEYGNFPSGKFAETKALQKKFQVLSKENNTLIIKLQKSVAQLKPKENGNV